MTLQAEELAEARRKYGDRHPVWARCEACRFVWPAAFAPADLAGFAKTVEQNAECPKCGGRGLMPKQDRGVLLASAPLQGMPE